MMASASVRLPHNEFHHVTNKATDANVTLYRYAEESFERRGHKICPSRTILSRWQVFEVSVSMEAPDLAWMKWGLALIGVVSQSTDTASLWKSDMAFYSLSSQTKKLLRTSFHFTEMGKQCLWAPGRGVKSWQCDTFSNIWANGVLIIGFLH